MFYMNYNDIEGLFQDAAENYQIRTDKAFDWDKINNAVHKKTGNSSQPPKPDKKNRRRFVFWFFLLISTGLFSYNVWIMEFQRPALQKDIQSKNVAVTSKKEQNKNSTVIGENADDKTKSTQQVITNKNIFHENKIVAALDKNNIISATNKKSETTIPLLKKPFDNSITQNNKTNNYTNNSKESLNQPLPFKNAEEEKRNDTQKDTATVNNTTQQTNVASSKKGTGKKDQGFYAGVQVSPDITFIKFQKAKGIGTNIGLTAGYRLNKKWSIETGISLNTKKYYTKGEYFDKSNVPSLSGVDLVSVSGNCTMIEIPLNVRYNFSANNKRNLTAAVGTSSYLMTREYYDYSLTGGSWDQTYHSSSKNLFAVINLSAGYERKISHNLTLKVEPYFKVPVSGIGTGKLHMSGTGINIGITKYFGKK